jgi:hypothetical protein
MQKEHPILFSSEMVNAILAGRKTMTRRIIKPQPIIDNDGGWVFDGKHQEQYDIHNWMNRFIDDFSRWMPGDRLWVRESFMRLTTGCAYKADGLINEKFAKWKPSIHMPKAFSRIRLEVRNIRVERLQNISEADAIAEGIMSNVCDVTGVHYKNYMKDAREYGHPYHDFPWALDAVDSYSTLWDKINGEFSWYVNPFVWVIEFKILNPKSKI